MRIYRYTVRPIRSFDFPIDMLRYDCAWPRATEDAINIALGIRDKGNRIDSVTLLSHDKPTAERWQSFGWEIVKLETLK